MKGLRQAMEISIKDLKKVIKQLESDGGGMVLESKKWSVAIVNKTPECSDTWEFEE